MYNRTVILQITSTSFLNDKRNCNHNYLNNKQLYYLQCYKGTVSVISGSAIYNNLPQGGAKVDDFERVVTGEGFSYSG